MSIAIKRSVVAEGREICYCLERKDVKNLNLRVRKNGSVFVSANNRIPLEEIDKFICSKAAYIIKAMDHFSEIQQYRPKPKQYISGESFYIQGRGLRLQVSQASKNMISTDGIYIFLKVTDLNDYEKKRRLVTRFLDQQCKTVFAEILDELYPIFRKYGIERPSLRIRDMETRWGSCLPKKCIITINKRLLEAPRNCIEYVVMHELCHLVHPNHSKHFYAFLSMLMPDWKERKKILEQNAVYWL
jgi:predicted metal-dependent hydrolase